MRLVSQLSKWPPNLKFFPSVGLLEEDVKRFKLQWNIKPKGLIDLRHLVKKFNPSLKSLGVKSLTEHYLKLKLDKHWTIRASNWEAKSLSSRQIGESYESFVRKRGLVKYQN